MNRSGLPEVVTRQCPGRVIGTATVRKETADHAGAVVWSATRIGRDATGGTPVGGDIGSTTLTMRGLSDGYRVTGGLDDADVEAGLELAPVTDDQARTIGDGALPFRKADLRRDLVLVGVSGRDATPRYVPRTDFAADLTGC